ncbi:MAG TPA: acyl-CoA dehydrogenase family protein [Planctomycetaceae bacterium]|jgi:alkylation response protein AidB-like acyl-CoA dehydrogenase|nr:acyl-CoA dehydrogenase family protein [Planctomycetaceae bacterium]
MEFDLSKPQKLLQKSARDLFARACPAKKVRELMATDTAFDAKLWSEVADQGWLGIHLSEASGGLGLSLVDLAVVAEEMGRACFPGPFLGTVWAATLIAEANPASNYLQPLAAGETKGAVALLEPDASWDPSEVRLQAQQDSKGYRLTGRKSFVSDAGVADVIVCVAKAGDDLALLAVPAKAAGVSIKQTAGLDQTRKLYDVAFEGVAIGADGVLAVGEAARHALERSMQVATLVVCADMLGGMQWILEDAVEYAKTRQQFGKPIGSFQAVQHMCADMLLWTESSRSAIYFAAWAFDAEPESAARVISTAKVYTSDASREVANRGVQVHGGIGFTWEHDLHLYYKRSKASEILFGDASHHRGQLADLVFGAC